MEKVEVDGNFIAAGNWKLHGALCKQLHKVVLEILDAIPVLEATRPGNSSGLLALSSLRIAVEKAKNLLQYCSECSKLYLALTADNVLAKFVKARYALLECLHQLEETLPEASSSQILDIANDLEKAVFALDRTEKQAGADVNQLIQNEAKSNGFLDENELEFFRQTAFRVGVASSAAALTERRALRRLLERAHAEEDMKKETVASYLLHLMRKYSSLFRSETSDFTNSSLCSSPSCSSSSLASSIDFQGNGLTVEKPISRVGSFNLRQIKGLSGSMPLPPEELRCPISLQLMYDPVVIASGQTYERACIKKWFSSGNTTCPKTRNELSQLSMTPNYCIKGLIASWCEQNGVLVPSAPPDSPKLKYLRISSLTSSKCLVTNGVSTVLFEDTCAKDDVKGANKVSSKKCTRQNSGDAPSEICEVEVSPERRPHENCGKVAQETCELWLRVLDKNDEECVDEQREVVEQIRFLLKDDGELRNYAGGNGITELLIHYLKKAVCRDDVQCQVIGTMALFNLGVSNDRNKKQLLSGGVIPLIEQMIQKPETYEAAIAMYLNLSCLPEAQVIIGPSKATPLLIRALQDDNSSRSKTCCLDALLTLYNLSLQASNIPTLIVSGVLESLQELLIPSSPRTEKAIAVLINMALTRAGKQEIAANSAMVGAIVVILDNGEPAEKEKAVSCLWIICSGDEGGSQMVLQEGVIPALVSLTANGTGKTKEKAQRLLLLFRGKRQRELEQMQPRVQLHDVVSQATAQAQHEQQQQEEVTAAAAKRGSEPAACGKRPRLRKSKSKLRRFTRAVARLLKKWGMR
uniref:RING-type E3 ubiquitin transferase n=1 Tax=Leersia perrieri TaxID=77586 RepID=A0A0D9W6I6_9ORYZ